jgi:hypothetical protein
MRVMVDASNRSVLYSKAHRQALVDLGHVDREIELRGPRIELDFVQPQPRQLQRS